MTTLREAPIRPTRSASSAGTEVVAQPPRRVSVVGGGASGVLTALQLLETDDPGLCVTVHEASGVLGRGLAYSTSDDRHLLNVRARHMSAFADVPDDLIDWAVEAGRDPDPLGFLSRADYAHYLQDRLARAADHRLSICAGRVTDLRPAASGWEVVTHDRVSPADTVVLALGHSSPAPLRGGDGGVLPDASWHLPNPWDLAALRRLPEDALVVLVGSGLTAVDAAITLLEDAPAREMVMVSRGGHLPEPHIARQHTAWVSPVPAGPLTADGIADFVRGQFASASRQGVDWRSVVDGLRPATQGIWQRMPVVERRRFLARHQRAWEVRRHRMAPEVAARIGGYRAQGRLRVVAGGLCGVEDLHGPSGNRCLVSTPDLTVTADAVVNCTGPLTDVTRSEDLLLRRLLDHGVLAPDELRLGLSTTLSGEVLDAGGAVVPGLFVVGPARRATLWESTAVPEIRQQAAQVAAFVRVR